MKQHIAPAIKLTWVMIIFFSVFYPISIWGIAQMTSNQGHGKIVEFEGKEYCENIGQTFNKDTYFWSRPSAVDYNAAGSGGSNKGPSNEEYLQQVEQRIEHFMKHHPHVKKSDIPMDMITASGSGLDPHISVKAAEIQVKRVANVRQIQEDKIRELVTENTEKPLLGIFGPEKINVLKLNIALEKLDTRK